MIKVEGVSFGEAWKKLNWEAFTGEPEHISSNAHYFNCEMTIKNPSIQDINMGTIGYTKTKFRNLVNLYWDSDEAKDFMARLHYYKDVSPKGKDYVVSIALDFNSRKNRTGACLQYLSIGQSPTKGWIVNVRTRANEIAQRLYADMVFVQAILKKICDEFNINLELVTVHWTIDAVYQSVIGCNLWMAICFDESKIKSFMKKDGMTKWQSRVQSRYEKNFNLDKDKRKVYNYSVQKRATYNYDRILNNEVELVPQETLIEMLPDLVIDDEVFEDLFGSKGGGR